MLNTIDSKANNNATDNLEEAEKIINDVLKDREAKDKTIKICQWLFEFNEQEKTHKLKCFSRNDHSIRFCFDRGEDCTKQKTPTVFLTIKDGFTLIFRLTKTNYPYLKQDGEYHKIGNKDARNLQNDALKNHILDAYCTKLKNPKFNLTSVYCKETKIIKTIELNDIPINYYTFQKEDFEKVYRETVQLGVSVSIDDILNKMKQNAIQAGHVLSDDWRQVTEQNMKRWSK